MPLLTQDWPDIHSTDDLSPEDITVFRRQVMDENLLQTFTRACNQYFHALRPDAGPTQPDLIIAISGNLSLYVRRSGTTCNGGMQEGVLISGDNRNIMFKGEIGKGFDRGIVSTLFHEGPVFAETKRLLAEFDAAIHRLEKDMRDEGEPDERQIAAYFSGDKETPSRTIKLNP